MKTVNVNGKELQIPTIDDNPKTRHRLRTTLAAGLLAMVVGGLGWRTYESHTRPQVDAERIKREQERYLNRDVREGSEYAISLSNLMIDPSGKPIYGESVEFLKSIGYAKEAEKLKRGDSKTGDFVTVTYMPGEKSSSGEYRVNISNKSNPGGFIPREIGSANYNEVTSYFYNRTRELERQPLEYLAENHRHYKIIKDSVQDNKYF